MSSSGTLIHICRNMRSVKVPAMKLIIMHQHPTYSYFAINSPSLQTLLRHKLTSAGLSIFFKLIAISAGALKATDGVATVVGTVICLQITLVNI